MTDEIGDTFFDQLIADGFTPKEAAWIVERLGQPETEQAAAAARARAREVVALCHLVGKRRMAARFVASGKSYADIQAALRGNPV